LASPTTRNSRAFDVVLWGATGFTGRLLAEYFTKKYGVGGDLRWAIAGRNREKLDQVRSSLMSLDARAGDLPLLVGDSQDAASLAPIVASTRVVATTVGPYSLYGRELVAACVEHGTDLCDITGETQFVRAMIDLHHARAKETGARIVHCCGFDSIPSDLGVLLLQTEMAARHGTPCAQVDLVVKELRGGFSGGTIASILEFAVEAGRDRTVRRIIADPYSLDPDRGTPGPDGQDQVGVRWDRNLELWTGPFLMAAINTRIVRRSNALLGYRYGVDFRYGESQATAGGPAGFVAATAMAAGIVAFLGLAFFPPTRAILRRLLPSPGEGPSKKKRESGKFVVKLVGSSGDGRARLTVTVRGHSDPGYGETVKMLGESAVCLAQDDLPDGGGVLTPAASMGLRLVERLRAAGMEFEVEEVSS
jgi:short subunit dehydrogenase-like uncharacterized protein